MIDSIHHLKTTESPQGPSLAFRQYWRDSRDRITAWQRGTDTRLNGKEVGDGDKFQYDAEGQLTDAWYLAQDPGGNMHSPLVQEHFQYDQLGNRVGSNQTVSYGVIDFLRRDNGLNQYASWTPSVIYHDDNHPGWSAPGNGVLMADGFITASYNALNQPRAIWSPTYAGTPNYVWFGFDPLGRCVKRWVGPLVNGGYPPPETNPATYFLYDGWNMIEEGPGGGGVTRVYAHGARVDEIIASSNEFGAVLFYHYDALGNCILLSDGAGNLSEQYDYEAFGKPYFYDTIGTNIPSSPWKNRYLGKGREWLSDLKLYDYRHRLYQPELGRFLQPDPKHFEAGDYNLYRYCHNDPVNHSDPSGLALDTFADIGFIAYDLYKVFSDPANRSEHLTALGLDTGAAFLPFATGAGVAYRAGNAVNRTQNVIEATTGTIKFGQSSIKSTFAHGPHAGQSIDSVAAGLRSGQISPDSLPVDYVVRNGQAIALNNRSLAALERAGLKPTVTNNLTGKPAAEATLDRHLSGNEPSKKIRVR